MSLKSHYKEHKEYYLKKKYHNLTCNIKKAKHSHRKTYSLLLDLSF